MKTLETNFTYPNLKEILPLIVEGIKIKSIKFFGTFESDIFETISYLIQTYYENGTKINFTRLVNVVKQIAEIYEMFHFFFNLKNINMDHYKHKGVKFVNCQSEEKDLIAVGVLDEDFKDSDNDPYETAGGYRSWIAPKGTIVKYYINQYLNVTAKFDSNCIVDHYNNNIGGVSLNNGTEKYKLGERIEKRLVILGKEFISKDWKKTEFKATVKKIDIDKALNICASYYPEFSNIKF